jgi:hypothetical protein
MYRILKSLLVLLMVAAFGVATIGAARALPCPEHHYQALHESVQGDELVSGCAPLASKFAQHPASQHETHDKCIHPCCASTATATLVAVFRTDVAMRVERDAFPIPSGEVLTGIVIAPLTGPPKLWA